MNKQAKARRTKKHRPKDDGFLRVSNPVTIAIAKRDIQAFATDISTRAYILADGSDATNVLARLAEFIGMAAEGERMANGASLRMKLLHGALRNIQGMCLAGYTWNAAFAVSMDRAMQNALAVITELPTHCSHARHDAAYFADLIRAHKVTPNVIQGAELYELYAQQEAKAA